MLELVSLPWLLAYGDMIKVFDEKYGHVCWPLLYQTLCRFETEHMVRMMRRENEALTDSLERFGETGKTPYDPRYPFDYLFKLASTKHTSGTTEREWWREHFVDLAQMVLAGVCNISRVVEGDRMVAQNESEHLATAHSHVPWALQAPGRQEPTGKPPRKTDLLAIVDREEPYVPVDKSNTKKTMNRKKFQLCQWYQDGKCPSSSSGDPTICPKHSGRRHQCHWCLANHPGNECRPTGGGKARGNGVDGVKQHKKKKGGKNGKGGGKGSGNGDGW